MVTRPQRPADGDGHAAAPNAARGWWRINAATGLIAFGLLIGAALAQQTPVSSPAPPPRTAVTIDRVVDGDTIVIAGERNRLLDVDAPELGHRADCPAEAALGIRAKIALIEAIAQTSVIVIDWDGRRDPFGRPLIVLLLDGTSAGTLLVQQGLAVPHTPERPNWCGSE